MIQYKPIVYLPMVEILGRAGNLSLRASSTPEGEYAERAGSSDTARFVLMLTLANLRLYGLRAPDRDKVEILQDFIALTLHQANDRYEISADSKAVECEPGDVDVAKTFWDETTRSKYGEIVGKINGLEENGKISRDEKSEMLGGLRKWFRTSNWWERRIRIDDSNNNRQGENNEMNSLISQPLRAEHKVNTGDENRDFRESTNTAYGEAMLAIINPGDPKRNEELNQRLIYPTLMIFQIVMDCAENGRHAQENKLTMDKINGIDGGGNRVDRIIELSKECAALSVNYMQQVRSDSVMRTAIARLGISVAMFCKFATKVVGYQALGKENEWFA